ncbi:hypothetical protein [Sphingomonas sp. BAUL-RG-20F-R05-02]|uniref:hypothetical protein n=1 Tax=Sphingomonas sp. BAUL-RG-20F-R05-02 TaxID=2914830 RepID=UPI001F55EEAA|nr:hypothetical protein [Sphingomonas sp. BAUL-RG-20F-R05-02]
MNDSIRTTTGARILQAARRLVEGDMADAAVGRFSRTVFIANRNGDETLEKCTFEAALEEGLGAIVLRYGRDANSTPRRANLAFMHEGERLEMRNSVLWSDDDGPILLVPFDAREDFHVGIGPNGLERRPGRPAALLGRGMSRAKERLERTSRDLRESELGQTVTILTTADAA